VFSQVDFVGRWRLWFAISAVMILAGVVAIALGNLRFGIDFEGGTKFTVTSPERQLDEEEVRDVLPDLVAGDAVIQTAGGRRSRRPWASRSGERSA
jgi:preprotein translocase subunit SecF